MTPTSIVEFNLGPYLVSFDTGIIDEYEIAELGSQNIETIHIATGLPVKYSDYRAIVTNKAKDDGVYIILRQYDTLMAIEDKRKMYEDMSLGLWLVENQPHIIDKMEGLVSLYTPPRKGDIRLANYCRATLRDDYIYGASYWPDESKLGPKLRNFSGWCNIISTYPWNAGFKNIIDSLKVRNPSAYIPP